MVHIIVGRLLFADLSKISFSTACAVCVCVCVYVDYVYVYELMKVCFHVIVFAVFVVVFE